ncbi:hypothetical protein PIB30_021655 [Stylosanthes scabra]|uniref:Uncharacterized protein n=1 Tax=Stylosanthes scabra TaxID=79078 RepID=A0ABU6YAR1_9FABA|nr:hypothetical protein [Stylosanthes scabra]
MWKVPKRAVQVVSVLPRHSLVRNHAWITSELSSGARRKPTRKAAKRAWKQRFGTRAGGPGLQTRAQAPKTQHPGSQSSSQRPGLQTRA